MIPGCLWAPGIVAPATPRRAMMGVVMPWSMRSADSASTHCVQHCVVGSGNKKEEDTELNEQ